MTVCGCVVGSSNSMWVYAGSVSGIGSVCGECVCVCVCVCMNACAW